MNHHSAAGNYMPCGMTVVTFPPLRQAKLVLDLETPEGCKAELIWDSRQEN